MDVLPAPVAAPNPLARPMAPVREALALQGGLGLGALGLTASLSQSAEAMFWLGIPVAATVLTVHLLIWALRRHTSPVVGVPVTVFATALALGGGLGLVNGGAPLLVLAWLPLSLALTLLHALTLGGRSVHGLSGPADPDPGRTAPSHRPRSR
jgi:hypothetical protein